MRFQHRQGQAEPEINLIPMIDVLLVILIFLMISTTFTHYTALQINLPQATGESARESPALIQVGVDAVGRYALQGASVRYSDPDQFSVLLIQAVAGRPDPVLTIHADGQASHQSVVNIMESARRAGIRHVTFTTQGGQHP